MHTFNMTSITLCLHCDAVLNLTVAFQSESSIEVPSLDLPQDQQREISLSFLSSGAAGGLAMPSSGGGGGGDPDEEEEYNPGRLAQNSCSLMIQKK
jgi:hypothetical protein